MADRTVESVRAEALEQLVLAGNEMLGASARTHWDNYQRLTDEANDLRLAAWWKKAKAELLSEIKGG